MFISLIPFENSVIRLFIANGRSQILFRFHKIKCIKIKFVQYSNKNTLCALKVVKSIRMKRLRMFAGDLGICQSEYEEITAMNTYEQEEQRHKLCKLYQET